MRSTQKRNRFRAFFAACAMSLSLLGTLPQPVASAANANWSFDFGNGGGASGMTAVNAATGYQAQRGYGFANTSGVKDVTASGSGAWSDAVQFTSTDVTNTFNVDLPNGLYDIKVTLGNTMRTSVMAEGVLQIINMTGNNAVDTIRIPVTDGQLNLMATAGKAGYAYTLSALEIRQVSADPTTPSTIWICGDSTVCNYYPIDTSAQAGWGQMLPKHVDTSKFLVRNLAASGQYAKGFVDAGQFAPVEKYGKPGDFYLISIGINDTNYSNADEYYATVTQMVTTCKKLGVTPILVKQQGRADDISRNPLLQGRWFGGTLDTIGKEQNVQVVDLFNLAQNYFLSIGQTATTALYMSGDTLHVNRAGADQLAKLVAEAVSFRVADPLPESKLLGDLNADDLVNALDLSLLKSFLLEAAPFPTSNGSAMADVNGDTLLNAADVQRMTNYLVRKTQELSDGSVTLPDNWYLAIDAAIESGIRETVNAGYVSSAYVNLDNIVGSAITWTVSVPTDGNYQLTLRNANGTAADRPMRLSVNGGKDTWLLSFVGTGAWTTWTDSSIVLPLKAGINTIRAVSTTASGGPNFDYLKLDATTLPAATPESSAPLTGSEAVISETPTIYLMGDSTVCNYNSSAAPQAGWGQMLGGCLTENVTVINRARGGRSSKMFINEGLWDPIYEALQPGDYLFIQFGINDANYNNVDRYAPVSDGTFQNCLDTFVKGAIEKGATPVLFTTVLGLASYSGGKFVGSYTEYCQATKDVATQNGVICVDLNTLMVNHYNQIGYDTAYTYHMISSSAESTDKTHFTQTGASAVAKLIAGALQGSTLHLGTYVKGN